MGFRVAQFEIWRFLTNGPFLSNVNRRLASYIDRIPKGANPGEMLIRFECKFELLINFKTARILRLPVPATLLARADEALTLLQRMSLEKARRGPLDMSAPHS